jgi:citrate lyase subunit beta-like protein
MRARRAILYTPGDDPHKVRKAAALEVDCVCLDLEDGVAINQKNVARDTIVKLLPELDFGRSERLVRINPVGSDYIEADLDAIRPINPDGFVIPKVQTGDQVRWAAERITEYESQSNRPAGTTILIAIVESARGIINLKDICAASSRLEALIFGAEDLAADLGAERSRSGWEVFYARSAVVTHAVSFGLQAIDLVNINFKDLDSLRFSARMGVKMGYTGKQVIHPDQIQPTQEIFTPSEEQINKAKDILDAYKRHQDSGQGAFAIDGKMIDAPIVKSAQSIIQRAQAAGKV